MTFQRSSNSQKILSRRGVGLRAFFCAMAFIAAWCLCPIRAQANCGDYVIVVNPSAEFSRNRPIEHPMSNSPCPCQGPQCRSSDSTPPMPVPAQITPDYGLMSPAQGEATADKQFGNSFIDDWAIQSEPHLLSPDPPPRSLS